MGANVYGVGASVYGSLVIIVSAQVLWVLTTLDFGLGLDNFNIFIAALAPTKAHMLLKVMRK